MRGLAVLLVVAGHLTATRVPFGPSIGVTLFFVLSGYLITSLLLAERSRTGGVALGAFYARRALRLIPALLVVVLVTPILMRLVGDPRGLGDYWMSALAALGYIGDFVRAVGGDLGVLNHTWSLAVEEQFYLIWPLVLVGLYARRGAGRLFPMLAALAGVAVVWRIVAGIVWGFDRVYFAPDTNAFALLLGCMAATVPPLPLRRWATPLVVACVAVLAAWSLLPLAESHGTGELLVRFGLIGAAAIGVVLVLAAVRSDTWLLANPYLRWFGTVSYGLYLWHQVLFSLNPEGHEPAGVTRLVFLVGGVALSAASWYLVERPLTRRFKGRFTRSAVPNPAMTGFAGPA